MFKSYIYFHVFFLPSNKEPFRKGFLIFIAHIYSQKQYNHLYAINEGKKLFGNFKDKTGERK